MNDMKTLEHSVIALTGLPVQQINRLQTFTFQHRTGLPRDAAIVFLSLEVDVATEQEFHALDSRIRGNTRLMIDYESVYGEQQVFDTDEYGPLPDAS